MKSGGYKKVREEIERLDKVINKRKGIVTHEHTEEKLGRSAARQKKYREFEQEKNAQLDPIRKQIALKIMEVTLAMNTDLLKENNENED